MILCHNRELAYQIKGEFLRLSKFMKECRTEVIYGGEPIQQHVKLLKGNAQPHIIVGTPGRILALVKNKALNLDNLKMFILDECDRVLENVSKSKRSKLTELNRHAFGCPKDLQRHASQQISDDVHRNSLTRNQINLPQIHA